MRKLCSFIVLFTGMLAGGSTLFTQEFSAGFQEKLLLPFLEVRSNQSFSENSSWNWGSVLYTSRLWKKFPCQIKTGNLTGGGGISKLKDPTLSQSITPFSKARTEVSEISASLPGLNTGKKPVSLFGEFCYSDKKKVFSSSKLNFFYNNEDIFPVFSGSQTVCLFKKLQLSFAATAGIFTYPENTFNSWFTTSDFFYHQGSHFCINPQVSLKVPHFETLFSAPTYQTPFGKTLSVYKTENKVSFGHSVFSFSLFYNEHQNLLTTRENVLKEMIQTKIGFQTTLPVGRRQPVFLRTGFAGCTSFMLSEKNFDSHKVKVSAGGRLYSMLYSFSLSSNAGFTIDTTGKRISTDFDSISFQFSNAWYFKKITPELKLGTTLTPSKNYESLTSSEKIGITAAFFKNPKITAGSSFSFTQKDGISTKQENTTSITASWRLKALSLTGKLTACLNF